MVKLGNIDKHDMSQGSKLQKYIFSTSKINFLPGLEFDAYFIFCEGDIDRVPPDLLHIHMKVDNFQVLL